ncbi:MAG: hypothetical protein ABW034_11420 [Steroidobacteraceae bacterium]
MNRLSPERRADILLMLCRGASLRGVTRAANVSINTVTKLLVDAGMVCEDLHDRMLRKLVSTRLLCCKSWSPLVTPGERIVVDGDCTGHSGAWTWSATDCDTGLIVSYRLGARDIATARAFIVDLSHRLSLRATTLTRAELAEMSQDGAPFFLTMHRGDGPGSHIRLERVPTIPHNLATAQRMLGRRFTRLRNGYCRKVENLAHMVAIYVVWHNFVQKRRSGRTRAVDSKVADRAWNMIDIVAAIHPRTSHRPR